MKRAIGIDIGGTKIAAGIVNEDGTVQHLVKVPSDISSKESMFMSTCAAIEEVLKQSGLAKEITTVGVGVPGLVDREAGVAVFQNNLPWDNFPIVERLKKEWPDFSNIVIDNDVYQAAYGEWRGLELEKEDLMVYLTVSTGVSCSIITEGKFLRGRGFAGELGLLPIFSEFQEKTERLEKLVSGPGLAEIGKEIFNNGALTTADIFQSFYDGNPFAKKIIQDWLQSLGKGLYALVCILDPHKIVLGGSVLLNHPAVLEWLRDELAKQIIPVQESSLDALVFSRYGNNSGVVGAGLRALASV